MHAARPRFRTSRRSVFRKRHRYSVCGLAPKPVRKRTVGGVPSTVAMCLALAICAIAMVRLSPVLPPSDATRDHLVSRYTIDDLANIMH